MMNLHSHDLATFIIIIFVFVTIAVAKLTSVQLMNYWVSVIKYEVVKILLQNNQDKNFIKLLGLNVCFKAMYIKMI